MPLGYDNNNLDECYEQINMENINDKKNINNKNMYDIIDLDLNNKNNITNNIETKIEKNTNIQDIKIKRQADIETYKIDNSIHHTLLQFYETNKNKKLPDTTNVSCFWCTEIFSNKPIGLPLKLE